MSLFFLILVARPSFPQAYELPLPTGDVYFYTGFSIQYNKKYRQADWVAYELTDSEVYGSFRRKDNFRIDPNMADSSPLPEDYRNSGYDRGHLAPAADMKWSEAAMDESFFMSNISPQVPQFNRGIWKECEEHARLWAIGNGNILIVSGPVITEPYETIGNSKVAVPSFFYKVIADITEPEVKGIAFLFPNRKKTASLLSFAVTIDFIEGITGIDFFYQLDNEKEELVESSADPSLWEWLDY